MKVGLLLCLVGALGGAIIGMTLGYQAFATSRNDLGPFSTEQPMTRAEVIEYFQSDTTKGVPKVEIVGGTEFNFGVMRRYGKANHQFVVKNIGSGTLGLQVTGSTCKCTVGTLSKASLSPGESTTIDMEWTAQTNSRSFGQSATLRTTDPQNSELSLLVKGDVIDVVAADPAGWTVGDVASAEPIEVKTTLFNHGSEPIEITDIQWLDDDFRELSEISFTKREVDPAIEKVHESAIEAFDISVSVKPGSPQGPISKRLRIEYQTPGAVDEEEELHPPLELQLAGEVVGSISIMGGPRLISGQMGGYRLNMTPTDVGKVTQEKVYLVFRGPKRDTATLRIGEIDPADALEAELGEPTVRGEMKVFPLTLKTKADAGEVMRNGLGSSKPGSIVIESDDPEVATIRLDVLFRIGNQFGS